MLRVWLTIFFTFATIRSFADSKYIYLFSSAKARSISGLARQKARRVLTDQDLNRASRLLNQSAISREEYETYFAAATVAVYDLQIAELRAKQAAISLDLALALARNGQRIPLCRRKKQSDENSVSNLLKRVKRKAPPPGLPETQGSGTKIQVREEPPPPPEVTPPQPPQPEPPQPPTPEPPRPDPPEPPSKPPPKPAPKPGPGSGPKPPAPRPPGPR